MLNIKTAGFQRGFPKQVQYHRYEPTPYEGLEQLFEHYTLPTKVDTAATEVVQTDTANVAPKDNVIQGPLYDIELCIVNSKNAAIRETLRLPQEMQPLVVLEQNPNNQQIRIILGLSNTRSHAIRTQAMLIDRYPDSCVIPHQEPNTASK